MPPASAAAFGGPPPPGFAGALPGAARSPGLDPMMLMALLSELGGPPPTGPEMQKPSSPIDQGLDIDSFGDDEPAAMPKRKKPKRKKPSEADLRSKADRIVSYWAERDSRMDEEEELYCLDRTRYQEGEGELVVLNTPQVVVDKAAALIGKQKPSLDVIPPRNDLREEAQQVEDFLRYMLGRWNKEWTRMSVHGPLLHDIAFFLVQRGWLTVRVSYNSSDDESATGPMSNPVKFIPYDPRHVYPDLGLRYVVHRCIYTVGELLTEWPEAEKLLEDGYDTTTEVEVTSYYDDWWHFVYCDFGTIKAPTAHEYGKLPWIIRIRGGSPIRATFNNTSTWTRNVGPSMLAGMKDSYLQLNKVMSQFASQVAAASDPPILYYYDPAHPEEPKPIKTTPGSVSYLMYNRERAEPLALSPRPSDAQPLLEALNMGIELSTLPRGIWGAGAAPSGFAQTLMNEAAEDVLWTYIEAIASALEEAFQMALEFIRDFHDDEVGYFVRDQSSGDWTGGVTITPDLIAEVGCEVKVTFKSISPRDTTMMQQLAIALTDKKLISLETARDEYLGLENPQRENERVLIDLINMDEKALKALVKLTAKRTAPEMYELLQQVEQEEKMAPPGGPGGPPGGPPGPPGMPPGGPPMPGMPPQMMPPIEQSAMQDPLAMLLQSAGSAAGGAGLQTPPGLPGIGGQLPPPGPVPGVPF